MTDQPCAGWTRCAALAIATALLVAIVAGQTHAQQASSTGEKPPSAAEVSPRAQGKTRDIKYDA
jgi:FlaG/FlaF family flagellin (archaellin)